MKNKLHHTRKKLAKRVIFSTKIDETQREQEEARARLEQLEQELIEEGQSIGLDFTCSEVVQN